MGKYIVKRVLIGIITLFALATITFFLMHIIPGSPFAGETSKLPAAVKEKLIAQYGLDQPLYVQFGAYLRNALTGDFGTSLNRKGQEVVDIIANGLPATVSLGLVAFVIAMVVGIFLGTVAAFSRQKWVSGVVAFIATIGVSVPSFLLALMMMLVFGVLLSCLPTIGLGSWQHYIMPSVALALSPIAMISRLVRTSLMDVMRQDYMVLARSKGTSELGVIIKHALKNALVPVITYAGPLIATLLTGSFVIETLFSVPGIGAEFVNSVSNRDYTLIMALTIFYGAFIIIANIVTDLITAAMDPRVRLK
ncbi:MAG TPA: ABC transporter permease [Candidatus Fimadaptatus faecigallinarum]|uniref:ABC transporter permease n=1 Tax=Candidatus Fimadaptatus faecigallinarum TaxID=2840814 RepID=A0A9D1S4L1_9FIRM|nr:ABC transporter permease [Candidatus Fimadaptatus faecigallinarum]